MQTKFKWIVLAIIGLVIIWKIIQGAFDNRPIKFESYKSWEDFEKKIRSEFPKGSDIDYAVEVLKESGATCQNVVIKTPEHEFVHMYKHSIPSRAVSCYYRSHFFIFTLMRYGVMLHADENGKIIYCGPSRIPPDYWP